MTKHSALHKTPLYEEHIAQGARVIDFGGWALPVHFSSQLEEHHAVRTSAGMFDVSHMTVSDITGDGTLDFLRYVLANDIDKARSQVGKALYSCLLNEDGGVIDDLIVYYLSDTHCRVVTNASTNKKVMAWLSQHAQNFDAVVTEQSQLSLIAVQGPKAIEALGSVFAADATLAPALERLQTLARFQGGFVDGSELFIGRTGYTGEDGVEIILPGTIAVAMWQRLVKANIIPCGLGARDTLRLEAGMALYGNDLDEEHTPVESGLKWTVALNNQRAFIGRTALEQASRYQMIGLVLEGRGVLRSHQPVYFNSECVGEVTSGSFSPTLQQSIALARVSSDLSLTPDTSVEVSIRNKMINARVVNYPFLP